MRLDSVGAPLGWPHASSSRFQSASLNLRYRKTSLPYWTFWVVVRQNSETP